MRIDFLLLVLLPKQRTCQVTKGRQVSHRTRKRDVCLQAAARHVQSMTSQQGVLQLALIRNFRSFAALQFRSFAAS
jgi:hypothetical protein